MKVLQRLRVRLFGEPPPPPPPRPGYGQPGYLEWVARYDSSYQVRACAIAALEAGEKYQAEEARLRRIVREEVSKELAAMMRSMKGGLDLRTLSKS